MSDGITPLGKEADVKGNDDMEEELDITEDFLQAISELRLGELSRADNFHLGDAMSAIELMDPKMDCGMIPAKKTLGLEKSIEAGIIDVQNMDYPELIATMDASLAVLVSWLQGQPLDQTVFINVCLHDPTLIQHPTLSAFTYAMWHMVNRFRDTIQMAAVFEEEDFTASTAFRPLSTDAKAITKKLKACETSLQKSKSEHAAMAQAVLHRICFLRHAIDLDTHILPPFIMASEAKFVPKLKEAEADCANAIHSLEGMHQTLGLGNQPDDDSDDDFSWLPVFQPSANRHLLPPSFPRESKMVTRVEAVQYLRRLYGDVSVVIHDLPTKINNLEDLMTFLRDFAWSDACVVARSVLQLVLLPTDDHVFGVQPLADVISTSIREFSMAGNGRDLVAMAGQDPVMEKLWNDFLQMCVRCFLPIVQLYGHNLARQRDKHLPACLEDLSVLQSEAEKTEFDMIFARVNADSSYEPKPMVLSSFIAYHTLSLMRYHFQLSFRLDLFVPYEFTYAYWYYGENVCKGLVAVLERLCNMLLMEYTNSAKDRRKQEKRNGKQKRESEELRSRITQVQQKLFVHRAEWAMSVGMFQFCVGLISSSKLEVPDGEALRFQRRMQPFASISAPLSVNYEHYLHESGFDRSGAYEPQCFKEAGDAFEDASARLRNLESPSATPLVTDLINVSKQNAIVSKLLASQRLNRAVTFRFSGKDAMFPVAKLL